VQNRLPPINLQVAKQNHLQPIVEQCLASFERTVGPQVAVERVFDSVSDVYVVLVHMKEVVSNILNNAAEAMDFHGTIKVRLQETKNEVVLQIEDTGKGIPKGDLSAIFDPFYSTKKSQGQPRSGTVLLQERHDQS
jgi:signal transduction histidine kinase